MMNYWAEWLYNLIALSNKPLGGWFLQTNLSYTFYASASKSNQERCVHNTSPPAQHQCNCSPKEILLMCMGHPANSRGAGAGGQEHGEVLKWGTEGSTLRSPASSVSATVKSKQIVPHIAPASPFTSWKIMEEICHQYPGKLPQRFSILFFLAEI